MSLVFFSEAFGWFVYLGWGGRGSGLSVREGRQDGCEAT